MFASYFSLLTQNFNSHKEKKAREFTVPSLDVVSFSSHFAKGANELWTGKGALIKKRY